MNKGLPFAVSLATTQLGTAWWDNSMPIVVPNVLTLPMGMDGCINCPVVGMATLSISFPPRRRPRQQPPRRAGTPLGVCHYQALQTPLLFVVGLSIVNDWQYGGEPFITCRAYTARQQLRSKLCVELHRGGEDEVVGASISFCSNVCIWAQPQVPTQAERYVCPWVPTSCLYQGEARVSPHKLGHWNCKASDSCGGVLTSCLWKPSGTVATPHGGSTAYKQTWDELKSLPTIYWMYNTWEWKILEKFKVLIYFSTPHHYGPTIPSVVVLPKATVQCIFNIWNKPQNELQSGNTYLAAKWKQKYIM